MKYRIAIAKDMHITLAFQAVSCYTCLSADVAQLVEQLIRNQQVAGSSPAISFQYGKPRG